MQTTISQCHIFGNLFLRVLDIRDEMQNYYETYLALNWVVARRWCLLWETKTIFGIKNYFLYKKTILVTQNFFFGIQNTKSFFLEKVFG